MKKKCTSRLMNYLPLSIFPIVVACAVFGRICWLCVYPLSATSLKVVVTNSVSVSCTQKLAQAYRDFLSWNATENCHIMFAIMTARMIFPDTYNLQGYTTDGYFRQKLAAVFSALTHISKAKKIRFFYLSCGYALARKYTFDCVCSLGLLEKKPLYCLA